MSALNYGKGALGFLAIRQQIGSESFDEAMREYSEEFRFGIAEPADLLATFERESGQDLDPLWQHWFERAETSAAEVENLFAAVAGSL
jgi:aminopeptidase N